MSHRKPFLTPADRQQIIAAYQSGAKTEAIAADYGCAVSSVSKIARRAGLPPRQYNGKNPKKGLAASLEAITT
jgi:transposase-like protein